MISGKDRCQKTFQAMKYLNPYNIQAISHSVPRLYFALSFNKRCLSYDELGYILTTHKW